jgi:hypothetical protein
VLRSVWEAELVAQSPTVTKLSAGIRCVFFVHRFTGMKWKPMKPFDCPGDPVARARLSRASCLKV